MIFASNTFWIGQKKIAENNVKNVNTENCVPGYKE